MTDEEMPIPGRFATYRSSPRVGCDPMDAMEVDHVGATPISPDEWAPGLAVSTA